MVYEFRGFELDEERAELRRRGKRVALQPKSLALLLHLLRNRDRAVPKQELLEVVWSGEHVVASALARAALRARRALGEESDPAILLTVRKVGYRFAADVVERSGTTDVGQQRQAVAPQRSIDPFVGRDDLLDRLQSLLAEAIDGRGQVVLISGMAGIGKTRTLAELVSRAERAGVECLVGRSFEGEGAPPFWPWTRMLRAFARDRSPASLREAFGPGAAEIAQAMPELQAAMPGLSAPPAIDSEQARFRLFDTISGFLQRAGRKRPLLLVLDDLHWADVDSLRLLHFVARELDDSRVLLVGLRRSAFALDAERGAILDTLAREHPGNCLDLLGLSESEIGSLVDQLVGASPPPDVISALHDRTAGNPLFLRSLFADAGRSPRKEGSWELPAAQGVHEAIERRLEHVGQLTRFALEWAAVVGRHFALAPVAKACELSLEAMAKRLDEAIRAKIIDPDPDTPGSYRFVHGLIPEVLYSQLAPSVRAARHAAIAKALESHFGTEVGSHLGDLAHHYRCAVVAGEAANAVRACERAAQDAELRQAHSEAARFWGWALEALDLAGEDTERRAHLWLASGNALQLSGAYEAARSRFRSAGDAGRSLGDSSILIQAALGLRTADESGNVDAERVALLEEALASVPEAPTTTRIDLTAALAETTYFQDGEERPQSLAVDAVRMARSLDAPTTLARALNAHHNTLQQIATAEQRSELSRELEAVAEQAGDPELLARAYISRIQDTHERSDREALERYVAKHLAVAQRLRQPRVLWQSLLHQAMLTLLSGPLSEAEPAIQRALDQGVRIHFDLAFQWSGVQITVLRREQDRFGEIEHSVSHLAEHYPTISTWRAVLALIEAESGRQEDAQRRLTALTRDGLAGVERDVNQAVTLALLADVACLLGDRIAAQTIYDVLLPFASKQIVIAVEIAGFGCASRFLGMLAQTLGKREQAIRHLEEGVRLDQALGAAPFAARGRYELARTLLADPQADDVQQARSLLAVCTQTAVALEMPRLISDLGVLAEPQGQ